jgi:uncharacterized protein YjbJ (UPF0337 family)
MDENRFEGTARNVAGKVQDAVGGLTGDTATQLRGKTRQVAGQAQDTYGEAADEIRRFAAEQPLTTILLSVGFGVMLGFLIARR